MPLSRLMYVELMIRRMALLLVARLQQLVLTNDQGARPNSSLLVGRRQRIEGKSALAAPNRQQVLSCGRGV